MSKRFFVIFRGYEYETPKSNGSNSCSGLGGFFVVNISCSKIIQFKSWIAKIFS